MGADYSFYVKSIATYAPAFFVYNDSECGCDADNFKFHDH